MWGKDVVKSDKYKKEGGKRQALGYFRSQVQQFVHYLAFYFATVFTPSNTRHFKGKYRILSNEGRQKLFFTNKCPVWCFSG